ncbi:hypothetical protein SDC9_190965 [bioreactor metagenome]|uniref:Uncharacterized protein n=1 Tax=bioreactor metagenome TaxID=1076179 RepID=A0A645HXS4_9ZZZZ
MLIANKVHQVMIVLAPHVWGYEVILQGSQLVEKVLMPVKHIDVRQAITIGPHFPVSGAFELQQLFIRQKQRITLFHIVGIADHAGLVVILFKQRMREFGALHPSVFKEKEKGTFWKRFAGIKIIIDILLGDRDISTIMQCAQMLAQPYVADNGFAFLGTDADVRYCDKTALTLRSPG